MSDYDWSRHLEEGEKVLWQGRPSDRFRLFLTRWDYALVPFLILWLLLTSPIVAMFLIDLITAPFTGGFTGLSGSANFVFAFPIALYMAFGRARLDRTRRRRYCYAVTTQRVLRADHVSGALLTSKEISPDLTVDVIPGHLTTIRLDPWFKGGKTPESVMPLDWRPEQARTDPGVNLFSSYATLQILNGYNEQGLELRMLPDGREVAELIKGLKAKSIEGVAA